MSSTDESCESGLTPASAEFAAGFGAGAGSSAEAVAPTSKAIEQNATTAFIRVSSPDGAGKHPFGKLRHVPRRLVSVLPSPPDATGRAVPAGHSPFATDPPEMAWSAPG